MKSKIITIVFLCFAIFVKGQNYIKNSGFEDGDDNNLENSCYHQDYYKNRVDIWESEYSNKKRNAGAITPTACGTDYGCDICARHSPDWYSYLSYGSHNPSGPLLPMDINNHIAGIGPYELLQQKISPKLVNNNSYLLSFRVFVPSKVRGISTSQGNSVLKFFIAKDRIKYKKDYLVHHDYHLECPAGYREYKSWGQDIVKLCEYDLTSFPIDQWVTVNCNISLNNLNMGSYNWFGIDVHRTDNEYDGGYAYIDDISLTEGCINGCSSTAGGYNVWTSGSHGSTLPFSVFGLENISHIDLEILTYGSYHLMRKISITNPPSIIAWNGKDDNLQELSPAWYSYIITVTNDCGTKEYKGFFYKINGNPTVQNYPFYNYNSVSKPPLADCCEGNIILQNQVLIQDITIGFPNTPPLLYKADQTITAGPQVSIPSDNIVIFEAGNYIDLLPGFEVSSGAEFDAYIVPCVPTKVYDDFVATAVIMESESEENSNNSRLKVYPNPFKKDIDIQFFIEQKGFVKIYITDVYGRVQSVIHNTETTDGVHSISYNASVLSPGLYFCVMENKNNRIVEKIIKQ